MEDPWANAWGEPSAKSALPEPSASATWSAPSVSVIHGDHEDDLSAPSWPTEPTPHWGAPEVAEASMWGNEAVSTGWDPEPSTFDKISLASKDEDEDLQHASPTSSSEDDEAKIEDFTSARSSPTSKAEHPSLSPPHSEPFPLPPPPRDLPALPVPLDDDGFGTFETAEELEESEWSPERPNFLSLRSADAAAWGDAWEDPALETVAPNDDPNDAWESARQQKEKQDRHVPPELLASILAQLEELSNDLWPNLESSSTDLSDNARSVDFEDVGLDPIVKRLVPEDLVLPPTLAFSKTFTSKQLADSLKLTRHAPLTRLSPMAMYMSSKGSTSWEASIKARPTVVSDDVAPAGWKIVETMKEDSNVGDGKKKSGSLFSFFGRRTTATSLDASPRRSASPSSPSGVPSLKTASPRPSIDSSQAIIAPSPLAGRIPPSSPTSLSFGSNVVAPPTDSKAMIASPTSDTAEALAAITRDGTPPPSAVSRFLGRFGSRSTKSSSKESIALSSDDLEFLSDVPTALDEKPNSGFELDALSAMIKSPPLPTTLPPPLPPPPSKPLPPSRAPSQPPQSSIQEAQSDDFMSFFDAPNPKHTSTPSGSLVPSLATLNSTSIRPINTTNSLQPSVLPLAPPPKSTSPTFPLPSQSSQTVLTDDDQSWASFDYPSTSKSMKATPPPTQSRRPAVVAIMSSSRGSASSSPSGSGTSTPFSLPPPPSFSQNRATIPMVAPSAANSTLPLPLAGSRSQAISLLQPRNSSPQVVPTPAPPANVNLNDDDDFSDFLSSPPPNPSQPLSFANFTPAATISTNTFAQTGSKAFSDNGFGDFDSFMSPLPPQPPAKSSSFASNAPNASTSKSTVSESTTMVPKSHPQANHSRKPSRKADHSRTISLLETAAARSGRWLAPPSPLPEALPAPPPSTSTSGPDLFGSTMQSQQAQAAAALGTSFSSPVVSTNGISEKSASLWNLPPPPSMNSGALQPAVTMQPLRAPRPTQAQTQPFLSPSPAIHSTPSTTRPKSGGLSAQDLSFFEGL